MPTTKVFYENDEGEEITLILPSKKEVCPECDGTGFVLCEGMRGYAYSQEEFEESFSDDEDREAYFTRGGKYDTQCDRCHGTNVIDVIDETLIPEKDKAAYAEYQKSEENKARWDAEDRATMRMENGGYD